MGIIEYNDFKKLEMRVGRILEVARVERTEKLYKFKVDIGKEKSIQIVSSLVPFYKEDELLNQRIIVLVNLKSTKFAGEISEGMLLAAEKDDETECVLLTTEKEMPLGTRIC